MLTEVLNQTDVTQKPQGLVICQTSLKYITQYLWTKICPSYPSQKCLLQEAQPDLHRTIASTSLLLFWPLQPWHYKATVYYKIFREPVMFSTLPSSLKEIKQLKAVQFMLFQQIMKSGLLHHFTENKENKHSLRTKVCS